MASDWSFGSGTHLNIAPPHGLRDPSGGGNHQMTPTLPDILRDPIMVTPCPPASLRDLTAAESEHPSSRDSHTHAHRDVVAATPSHNPPLPPLNKFRNPVGAIPSSPLPPRWPQGSSRGSSSTWPPTSQNHGFIQLLLHPCAGLSDPVLVTPGLPLRQGSSGSSNGLIPPTTTLASLRFAMLVVAPRYPHSLRQPQGSSVHGTQCREMRP